MARELTTALDYAASLVCAAKTKGNHIVVRVYAVEVPANAWGQCREYWVGTPPPGTMVVQEWEVNYPRKVVKLFVKSCGVGVDNQLRRGRAHRC